MKFTEEQYREIVDAWNEGCGWEEANNNVLNTVKNMRKHTRLRYGEALALGNPVTREYAHERFVEKEKKYKWRSKSDNRAVINKSVLASGEVSWFLDRIPTPLCEFTETEIKNSPFKPEWFDKEEV